jgi:hypothetical protein
MKKMEDMSDFMISQSRESWNLSLNRKEKQQKASQFEV